jgi:hypothetical protein
MYWKYHLKAGDAVKFRYEDDDGYPRIAWGSVSAIVLPSNLDPDEIESTDDLDFDEIKADITSGRHEITVPLSDIKERVKKEDRETDLPQISEQFRLNNGMENYSDD